MITVFIGGSRAVAKLNAAVRERLDDLIQRGCHIFIGDANGADKAVQQHFAGSGYSSVTVFCVGTCRNNVGGWPVREVASESTKKDFAYYATKDAAMAREAGCGVMLWDGKSKGTLHNIINLLGAGKKVLVYFSPEKAFRKLSTGEDLTTLLARCNGREIERLQSSLAALPSRAQDRLPFQSR